MSSSEKFERDFEAFLKQDGDSQLAAVYRKLPQAEPDAKLDAAVLAMAHRALNPQLVATPGRRTSSARRRARWVPGLSAVATAVFAIGVAVKMGPQLWSERHSETPAATSARDGNVVQVRPIEAPVPPPPPLSPPPPPASNGLAAPPHQEALRTAAKPAPPPAAAAPPQAMQKSVQTAPAAELKAEAQLDRDQTKKVESIPPARAAPQAFPGGSRQPEMDSVERKQAIAEGAWQRLHDNESAAAGAAGGATAQGNAPVMRQQSGAPSTASEAASPAPASAPANEQRSEREAPPAAGLQTQSTMTVPTDARSRSDSGAAPLQTQTVSGQDMRRAETEPRADVDRRVDVETSGKLENEKAKRDAGPSGYSAETLRNSRLYPESWVAAIQRLVRDGKREDARQNLKLFREKYPGYRLPADLERLAREAR